MTNSETTHDELFSDIYYLHQNGEFVCVPEQIKWQPEGPICSIIIPCYNYGHFLKEAINSALNQTLQNVEVIVVDDGSTDAGTKEVLRTLIGNDRIKVVLKGNEGLSEARNSGIRLATGKYICCLDADDLLHSSYLEHCVYELERDGYRGFVYSWVRLFGTENYIWQTRAFDIKEAMVDNHTSVSAVFRKSDWLLAGQYDRRMEGGYEDWEFWLRIAQLGRKGHVIKSPLFFHRRHGRTMTHDAHEKRQHLIAKKKSLNFRLFNNDVWHDCVVEALTRSDPQCPSSLEKRQVFQGPSLLCVLPWLKAGGAETLMLDILEKLSEIFHICILTTLDDDHAFYPGFSKITKDIFHFPASSSLDEFVTFVQYLAKTRNAWSILTSGSLQMYEALPLLEKVNPGKFRTVDILHNDSKLGHIGNSIRQNLYLSGTVGVSGQIVESLVKVGIDTKKVRCILNGVDGRGLFTPSTAAIDTLAPSQKMEPRVLGFIGRAAAEKRPLLFVELIHKLSKSLDIHGFMVSSGYMENELRQKIEEYGLTNITLLPEVKREDLPDLYRKFDVLVNVSSIEGMPLTVVEALACGCPVAAMEVGNLSNVITHGENGILVGKDQFDLLVPELINFLSNAETIHKFKSSARLSFDRQKLDLYEMLTAYQEYLSSCFFTERGE